MAETGIVFQYFEHLAAYSIAICKECRHGVLPSDITDPRSDNEGELVEAAIWEAMDGLTRFSQASVRLEAIRMEKHQTQFQPLQSYMDRDAIVKHTRPWQQMLMFFARTQREHGWKSPQYQFR
jgi:hypothetical protein